MTELQLGRKIFVFKGMVALDEEVVFPLAALLRRYGPATLMFVSLADARHEAGTVERRSPGFLVGYPYVTRPGTRRMTCCLSNGFKFAAKPFDLSFGVG